MIKIVVVLAVVTIIVVVPRMRAVQVVVRPLTVVQLRLAVVTRVLVQRPVHQPMTRPMMRQVQPHNLVRRPRRVKRRQPLVLTMGANS